MFNYMPDTVVEMARDVQIKLHHHIGKYIKIQLSMLSRWLLISEVSFDSGNRNALVSRFCFVQFHFSSLEGLADKMIIKKVASSPFVQSN